MEARAGNIMKKRLMSFAFEKTPRISLRCKASSSPMPRIRRWPIEDSERKAPGILQAQLANFKSVSNIIILRNVIAQTYFNFSCLY